jgi:chemotaxis protein CheX
MDKFTNDEIIGIMRESARSVFSTMLNLPLEDCPPRVESGDPDPVHGMIALVGIAGSWTGTGRIFCSAEFAQRMANAMLFAEYDSVNDEVLDSVAEVANMVIGNIKTALEERLGSLWLSVPTVIYGRNYQARTANAQDWVVVPFRCEGETMEIRFFLAPTRTFQRGGAPRFEATLA